MFNRFRLHFCFFFFPLLVSSAWGETSEQAEARLTNIELYSAGLGRFTYCVNVEEASTLSFPVPIREVSDVLRSIDVRDPETSVRFVRVLENRNQRTVDNAPPSTDSLVDCLVSLKGESLTLHLANGEQRQGRLLALENSLERLDDSMVERVRISLATDRGLQTALLEDVVEVQFDENLARTALEAALDQAAPGRSASTATIEIGFAPGKARKCSVAYSRPVPVWKSCYTLQGGKLNLQIVVNNAMQEDWNDVELKIRDGRPVSFFVDVHQEVRTQRRNLQLPVGLPGLPPIFEESQFDARHLVPAKNADSFNSSWASNSTAGYFGGGMGGMGGTGGMGGMPGGTGGMGGTADTSAIRQYPSNLSAVVSAPQEPFGTQMELAAQVFSPPTSQGAGSGDNLGLAFARVQVDAGTTALLPARELDVDVRFLSIYSEDYHESTPMLAVEFVNKSNTLYPSGPISLLDRDGVYLGEAMLPELCPGVPQLVGYGVDRAVHVTRRPADTESTLSSIEIIEDSNRIKTTRLVSEVTEYDVSNRSSNEKLVIIQIPADPVWQHELHEGDTQSETCARLAVEVSANQSASRDAARQQSTHNEITYLSVELAELKSLLEQPALKATDKQKLAQILNYRSIVEDLQKKIAQAEDSLRADARELDRLVRILSTQGLQPATIQSYAKRIESHEQRREQKLAELKDWREEVAHCEEFLTPAASSNASFGVDFLEELEDDPFGH